jgi:predicted Fe-Mo cluster-binding NifX family protein
MKIAIPVDRGSRPTAVCASFGRAPYFLFYESETGESTFVENMALNSPGGAGIKAAQLIADNQARAVLTPRCGENAAQVLQSSGIQLYKTSSASVEESIENFLSGELAPLDTIHAGFHHGGD